MKKQSFSRNWHFHLNDVEEPRRAKPDYSTWRLLDLPHDWSIELPRDAKNVSREAGGWFPMGIGWYQKFLTLEPESDELDELDEGERRRLELLEARDRSLAALKELELDHRTGKVNDEDYRALVAPLRRRAAESLRALDAYAARTAEPGGHMSEIQPETPETPQPAVVPEPTPVPHQPVEPAVVPEPLPPPDEGDRPTQPDVPEPTPR